MRAHPELTSTFLSLRAAAELAERKIADPLDRERFLALVKDAMAASIHAGQPLPSVKLRNVARTPSRQSEEMPPKRITDERTR